MNGIGKQVPVLLIAGLLVVARTVLAQDTRPLVVVFDFAATELSDGQVRILTDYISDKLVDSKAFRVINREQRQNAMSEIGFAASGLSKDELHLRVGQFLAADYLLDGSIGRIGTRYLLNLKFVDVKSAVTLSTASERYNEMDALVDKSAELTLGLVGKARGAVPKSQETFAKPAAEQTLGSLTFGTNGTVMDRDSGLMWSRDFREDLSFEQAETYCANLETGGYTDWRLPTAAESASLVEALKKMDSREELGKMIELLGQETQKDFLGDRLNKYWTSSLPSAQAGPPGEWWRTPGGNASPPTGRACVDMDVRLGKANQISNRGTVGRVEWEQERSRFEARAVRRP
jgi:TolB-like protein